MGNTSPLRRAILDDDLAGVKAILDEHGECAPDIINEDFTSDCILSPFRNVQSPLHTAVSRDQTDMVRLLLQYGADVNAPGLCQQTGMHLAAARNNIELCRLALQYDGDLYAEDDCGKRPIHSAAMSIVARDATNALALQYTLGEVGKPHDVSLVDDYGNTPLHCAAWIGNSVAVQYLLKNGADSSAKNKHDKTPRDEANTNRKQDAYSILSNWKY